MKIHCKRDTKVQPLVAFQDDAKSAWIGTVWIGLRMYHVKIHTTTIFLIFTILLQD